MTIAESIKSYYESEDFKSDYAINLMEDRSNAIDRIQSIAKNEYYFEKFYGKNIELNKIQCEQIIEFIENNYSDFETDFHNYYVGSTCIDSVSFGEQCEQLEGLHNCKTGKNYTLPYLKKCFDEAGFVVNDDNYAYYDMSGSGIMIDLIQSEIPLIKELIKSNTDES